MTPASVWLAPDSFAVHNTGEFELDGNIVWNGTAAYDWGNLFDAAGNQTVTPDPNNGPLLASSFLHDAAVPDPSYFTSNGAGVKDINPIANWGCTVQNNPLDKDNLLNAYAALVQVPAGAPDNAGDKVLYLGSERGSNNGTSFAGFWLLKDNSVSCNPANGAFVGHHTDGDILVVSDYTNGGTAQDVTVYRWTGNDATGSLSMIANGGVCGSAVVLDNVCAIANTATVTSAWSPTSHITNTFVEAGIDLTHVLNLAGNGGCFTTFLAETRSSNQLTATLKDYAGGQFNTCPPAPVQTQATPGGTLNAPGVSIQHDVATLSAVGTRPTPTGTVTFFLCGPSAVTSAGCPEGAGTQVGSAVTVTSGTATSGNAPGSLTTALGTYCWRAEYAPDAAAANYYTANSESNATSECFQVQHASPTISTQIAVTGTNAPGLGFTTLGDTATLHGALGNTDGEGVTFNLYGPYAQGVTPSCTGQPVFTTTGTLSGGSATTTQTYLPTAAGTYVWVASYGGDPLNDGATGKCTDTNESVTIIGAHVDVSKAANPPGPVSAGDTIGFDITVSNSGAIPAQGVQVSDPLPSGADGVSGGDLNWQLAPGYTGCTVNGSPGSQTLNCSLGTVGATTTLTPIHVQSSTSPADCGVVKNKASVSTTNGTGGDSDVATVTVLCPMIHLVKTPDAASVTAGDDIGFTVAVSSVGPAGSIARSVTINDPLPSGPGIDWVLDAAHSAANCAVTGAVGAQVLTCTGVDLATGQSYSAHVTSSTQWTASGGTVTNSCLGGNGQGEYDNTAHATSTNAASDEASAQTLVICPSLHLTKTADAPTVDAGTAIGFTVTMTNNGPGTARGVIINDALPSGTGIHWVLDAAHSAANCTVSGPDGSQVLTCTGVDLASGASEQAHVTSATVFASCMTYVNVASATATNEPNIADASASTTVQCAHVVLTKTADHNAPVNVGTTIGFTVTITNTGPADANGLDVEDPLPIGPGITWSIDAAGTSGPLSCSVTGATLSCTGNLAADATEVVHVTSPTEWVRGADGDINSCLGGDGHGVYNNTAHATWTDGPDGGVSSNQATEQVICPSLTITKTAAAPTVSAGDPISFTVELKNGGPGAATNVAISDPLPGGTGVSWTISSQTVNGAATDICTIAPNAGGVPELDCHAASAPNGFDLLVTVTSTTTKDSCGSYDNTATFTADNEPGANASASTQVLCPNPKITKSADASAVTDTQPIGYLITVTNDNSLDVPIGRATQVSLSDPLPLGPSGSGVQWTLGTVLVRGVPTPDACRIDVTPTSQTLNCTFGDLAPGESASVHVTSNTSFASCGDYPNTATASASNANPVSASATTAVICPALDTILVKADQHLVPAQNPIGFTLSGKNVAPLVTASAAKMSLARGTSWAATQGVSDALALTVPPGSVLNAVMVSHLPAGPGVDWKISPAYTGQGTCAISGAVGAQVLTCDLGTLAPQAGFSVHISSPSVCDTGGPLVDSATLHSSNVPDVSSSDHTAVVACAITVPKPPAVTGVAVGHDLGWAVGLIVAGFLAMAVGARRRAE